MGESGPCETQSRTGSFCAKSASYEENYVLVTVKPEFSLVQIRHSTLHTLGIWNEEREPLNGF